MHSAKIFRVMQMKVPLLYQTFKTSVGERKQMLFESYNYENSLYLI